MYGTQGGPLFDHDQQNVASISDVRQELATEVNTERRVAKCGHEGRGICDANGLQTSD